MEQRDLTEAEISAAIEHYKHVKPISRCYGANWRGEDAQPKKHVMIRSLMNSACFAHWQDYLNEGAVDAFSMAYMGSSVQKDLDKPIEDMPNPPQFFEHDREWLDYLLHRSPLKMIKNNLVFTNTDEIIKQRMILVQNYKKVDLRMVMLFLLLVRHGREHSWLPRRFCHLREKYNEDVAAIVCEVAKPSALLMENRPYTYPLSGKWFFGSIGHGQAFSVGQHGAARWLNHCLGPWDTKYDGDMLMVSSLSVIEGHRADVGVRYELDEIVDACLKIAREFKLKSGETSGKNVAQAA